MAISVKTPIPTPKGWMLAGDVYKDNILFANGGHAKVKVSQLYTPRQCYEITFDDGLRLVGDEKLTMALQKIGRAHV